jgi:hypothetical protein
VSIILETSHNLCLIPQVSGFGFCILFELNHRFSEVKIFLALQVCHGFILILLEQKVVNAVIVLVNNNFAGTILSERGNIMSNSEESLLAEILKEGSLVQNITNQVTTKSLHCVPHVIEVAIADQEDIALFPCTIINVQTDQVTRVVSCGDIGASNIILVTE